MNNEGIQKDLIECSMEQETRSLNQRDVNFSNVNF